MFTLFHNYSIIKLGFIKNEAIDQYAVIQPELSEQMFLQDHNASPQQQKKFCVVVEIVFILL